MTDLVDHRRVRRGGLFVNDEELIERLGVPYKTAKAAIRTLDLNYRKTGFPQKRKLWGDRRYWPAVEKWLEKSGGLPENDKMSA
jgi:hypothetical protein